MSARNIYLLLAREVSVDASDNMNSIIKIIEKFTSHVATSKKEWEDIRTNQQNGLTTIPISYAIASSWLFDKKLATDTFVTLRVQTVDPDGNVLASMDQEHLIPKDINKANLNVAVQGLPIGLPGHYKLRASLLSKSKKVLAENEYPYEVELFWDDKKA